MNTAIGQYGSYGRGYGSYGYQQATETTETEGDTPVDITGGNLWDRYKTESEARRASSSSGVRDRRSSSGSGRGWDFLQGGMGLTSDIFGYYTEKQITRGQEIMALTDAEKQRQMMTMVLGGLAIVVLGGGTVYLIGQSMK
jgi:hypothetical protein